MNKPVAWMYRVNNSFNTFSTIEPPDDAYDKGTLIPLYTQEQLEESRKLGMQQERALWNLSESTQEIENPYKAITNTKIEPTAVSYNHPAELTDEEIIESLAELEHEQWMKWADTIMQTEKISDSRFARWASCMIPYAELSEKMKEHDRVWARQALAILRKAQEKC